MSKSKISISLLVIIIMTFSFFSISLLNIESNNDTNIKSTSTNYSNEYSFKDIQVVSSGYFHTALLDYNGDLWIWGRNTEGQLGLGNKTNYNEPVQLHHETDGVIWEQVSLGGYHSAAIDSNGDLWTWGWNGYGQLGLGDYELYDTPQQVIHPNIDYDPNVKWEQVSVGAESSAAIDSNGDLWTWGGNNWGQLGLGDHYSDSNYLTPQQVQHDSSWEQVSLNMWHSAAIDSNGDLYTWGQNSVGQLGLGENYGAISYNSPQQVQHDETWTQVSTSYSNTAAIDSNGDLYTWGENDLGQLGLGDDSFGKYNTPQIVWTPKWKCILNTSFIR